MTVRDIPAVDRLLKREFQAHRSPIIELIEAQTQQKINETEYLRVTGRLE